MEATKIKKFYLELGKRRNREINRAPTIMHIGKVISDILGIPYKRLEYEDRHTETMFARHVWRNVACIFGHKEKAIALVNNCHRTTVYNSIKNHEAFMLDKRYNKLFKTVMKELNHFKIKENEKRSRQNGQALQNNEGFTGIKKRENAYV